jgi:glycosyltransferase involved in cell wall biosynthesis
LFINALLQNLPRKMRILHVIPAYLPASRYGGPSFAVHGLCRALVARGHHVEVFTTNVDGPNDTAVPLGTPVSLDGVQIRYFPSDVLRRLFWSPLLARVLRADIAGFTIVHLHSVFLWPTWAAARSARNARIPYIISPRGMLVKELIERRNRIVKQAWIKLIEQPNLERAAAIHVTSSLEAYELKRFGWRLPRLVTIPNGLDDIQTYSRDEVSNDVKQITSGRPFILFLGRISWKKGLDRLLKALAPTRLDNLVIVGPDDEKLAPRLAQLARDLKIADRVRLLPRTVLGSDKEYLYQNASTFVLPSYSENFGNSVLEAMQRGVPVVVTPEVGAAEIVSKSGGGIVVSGDPEPLGAAIVRLVADPALSRSMGESGKRHVMVDYSWTHIGGRMEGMYESLSSEMPDTMSNASC